MRTGMGFLVVAFITMPVVVMAQLPTPGGKLVPCTGANDCNFCALMQLAQNILNFAVYAAMIGAAVAFCYAGYLYVSAGIADGGPTANITAARKMFGHIVTGIVIVLAAWLVVSTVLEGMLKFDLGSLNRGCRINTSVR